MTQVQLFVTCLVDLVYPEVGERTVSLLERLGCDVAFPEKQTCCGQPAFNTGYPADAKRLAQHFLETFGPTEGTIVAPFGSCVHMVRHNYSQLVDSDPKLVRELNDVTSRIYDIASFIVDVLGHPEVGGGIPGDTKETAAIYYHHECHLARGLDVREQTLSLIEGVDGCKIVNPEHSSLCCGFGGTFALKETEISTAMADEKIDRALEAGAEAVVSTDVGCLMQLEGRIRARKLELPVYHLVDLLEPAGTL